ncbi:MAG: hypothetical protein ACRELC_12660 [Gemmatimonadota bacterium]
MDDARSTAIATGIAAGGSLAALLGGVPAPQALAVAIGAIGGVTWLVSGRRAAERERARLGPVVGHPGARDDRGSSASRLVFRRDETDGGGGGFASEGPSPPSRLGSANGGRNRAPAGRARPPCVAESAELERLAADLEDEDTAEEISFLPPYASDEAADAEEPHGQHADAWDALYEASEPGAEQPMRGKMPVPRHFALGTVAVIRKLLEPEQVERILTEQRRYPRLRFGDAAVQLRLLTDGQLQELLLAQQEGRFTDAELRDARDRLRAFRRQNQNTASGR